MQLIVGEVRPVALPISRKGVHGTSRIPLNRVSTEPFTEQGGIAGNLEKYEQIRDRRTNLDSVTGVGKMTARWKRESPAPLLVFEPGLRFGP